MVPQAGQNPKYLNQFFIELLKEKLKKGYLDFSFMSIINKKNLALSIMITLNVFSGKFINFVQLLS